MSMPERIDRGLWPHPPLRFSEVVQHLTSILKRERWFPREWYPHTRGEVVHEGGVIERKDPGKYVYRTARAQATNPYALAEVIEKVFRTPEDAARHYLVWDLHLPGNLDGWKVIE
jgi:hypothetical protein